MEKVLFLNKKYNFLLNQYGLTTRLRRIHFFTQLFHESKCIPVSENLNYSAKRLVEIFKHKFDLNKDGRLDIKEQEKVLQIANKPQLIANFLYANKLGNGNEASGDGWKYRGRGFIQTTLKNNYIELSKETDIDFVNNPDLLLEENNAMLAACFYWNKRNLNRYADTNNLTEVRIGVNGGKIGLLECKKIYTQLEKIL